MKAPLVKTIFFLLVVLGIAVAGSPATEKGSLEGIVVPDDVHGGQPFSFAALQAHEGDVISIKTVDGVVVSNPHADKYGRIFLSAGLPAGAYLISRADRYGHDATDAGKFDVRPAPSDALQRTWEHPPQTPRIVNPPQSARIGDPLWISGRGFSPNCADMQANVYASGATHSATVLAASEHQLKLAPVTDIKPGAAELTITNQATRQSTPSEQLFFYDLDAHLQQDKLKKGQQTSMVLVSLPPEVRMKVRATISGQATFSGGQTTWEGIIDNHGTVTVPIQADKGIGSFHVDYDGEPLELPRLASCGCGCGGTAQPACAHKGCACGNDAASTRASHIAGCSCGCGGTAQPACAHKGCSCSKAMALTEDLKRQMGSCACGCGGTAQPGCAFKGCACAKAAAVAGGLPVSLRSQLENVSQLMDKPTGKAACSCGCGGTAQPRCAHKACGCGG